MFETAARSERLRDATASTDEFRYAISKMCNLVEGAIVGYAGVGKARRGIFAIQFTWTLDCDGIEDGGALSVRTSRVGGLRMN